MTPDQIFKAEQKLRELKKIEEALSCITEYVFGVELSRVRGPIDFPLGSAAMSAMLREAVEAHLNERKWAVREEIIALGVNIG